MAEEKKKGVDWLQDVSSDEDEDIVEDDVEEQNQHTVVESVQNEQGKKQKPIVTPFNQKQHVRNKNTKRIKGGFKAELAQKKVTHLKAMKNPFDVGASDSESGNEQSQNQQNKEQAEKNTLKLERNEGETQDDYQARVKQHEQKEKERIQFQIQEKKRLDEAIQKANKLNKQRAAAKAAKKQKKKKLQDQNIDALLKQIQTSQKPTLTSTQNADKKKKKKQKVAKEAQTKAQVPKDQTVPPVQQQILSIQEVMKRKAANSTTNKGNKKKPDLGAAKREIQSRNAKQKTKKTDLDL